LKSFHSLAVDTAFGDGQKRDGLASHGAKQSVGVAREPDRNADACFGPHQRELRARPGIDRAISEKVWSELELRLTGIKRVSATAVRKT